MKGMVGVEKLIRRRQGMVQVVGIGKGNFVKLRREDSIGVGINQYIVFREAVHESSELGT
jgi:hypothetical protein